jgi:hypothetical protein
MSTSDRDRQFWERIAPRYDAVSKGVFGRPMPRVFELKEPEAWKPLTRRTQQGDSSPVRRTFRFLPLVAWVLLWPASDATACSCMSGIPLCESFWKTPVVFDGDVLRIERIPDSARPSAFLRRLVTFKVIRAYRGGVESTIQIATGSSDADCGYPFEIGDRYLVYAHDSAGTLSTGLCSRTRPLSKAAEDLEYLETAFDPSPAGRIFGRVTRRAAPSAAAVPAPGYRVVLRSPAGELTATSDAEGRYEFAAVAPGTSVVRIIVDDSEHAYGSSPNGRRLELPDSRGCAAANFYIVPNGRIVVRAVDSAGRPLANTRLELVAADAPTRSVASAMTTAGGQSVFRELWPGRYVIAINVDRAPSADQPYPRLFYPGVPDPGAALAVDLGRGERSELGPFVLPAPLQQRQLSGRVEWPDGRPAPGTDVYVVGAGTSQVVASTDTDADGKFTLAVYDGVTYRLIASHSSPPPNRVTSQARLDGITIEGDVGPVRVVIRPLRR